MDAARPLSEIPNDLTSCENEPLRFIGAIQSIGCLLAFTPADHRLQAASENVAHFLGREHRDVVSQKLEHVIGPVATEQALAILKTLSAPHPRASFKFEIDDRKLDAVVYTTDGLAFVEIEPRSATAEDYTEVINAAFVTMLTAQDLRAAATAVCTAVHRITGLDRVMMYRFLAPHQHGEVVAEHRVLSAHSYFQQRFPASDIPQIARDLYLRNSVRQIPDIDLAISRVKPIQNPTTGRDIDLSDSRLRAVSPIHLEYLRNMKVACSFSVAVIVDGRLWGLIACHHMSAKRIPVAQRNACELLGNAFAGQARLIEASENQARKIAFLTKLSDIFESVLQGSSRELLRKNQQIFETFRATGLAIVSKGAVDAAGMSPPRAELQTYAKAFLERMKDQRLDAIAVESLAKEFPALLQLPQLACGTLALKIDDDSVAFLFRPELIETIVWGGDPRKQLDRKNLSGRINPRTSFEAWEETIGQHSLPWLDYEIEGFEKLKALTFDSLLASR